MNFLKKLFSKKQEEPNYIKLNVHNLEVGKIIIVIKAPKKENPIVQDVHDFQYDMNRTGKDSTNLIKLETTEFLEKGRTYIVEEKTPGTKTLEIISMMIMGDVMFG